MKLYTKRGDDGTTGLIGGQRVPKSDLRVTVCGEIDETNAAIGLVRTIFDDGVLSERLGRIQSDLFVLGAEVGTQAGRQPELQIQESQVGDLETWIDDATAAVSPLSSFILPGGCEAAARLHIARSVCRRAERSMAALASTQPIGGAAQAYVNRLSDLLFALARRANQQAGVSDIPWEASDRS